MMGFDRFNRFDGIDGFCRNMAGPGWIGMLVGGLLFLGLVVLGMVLLVRYAKNNSHSADHPAGGSISANTDNALKILNERYARGEINDDEYAAKKNELRK
ncbi:MAG: SHOCT domain-containing protein [Saccharofermentanales bacterium]